jgi:hypothetical protein
MTVEYLKLKEGLSTYFVVLTLQTNWQQAQIQQIVIEKLFSQNLTQLRFLSGKLINWISEDKEVEPSDVNASKDIFSVTPCKTMGEKESESCETLPDVPLDLT